MKVRRDIASIPKRSAAQTWKTIIDLITGTDTVTRRRSRMRQHHGIAHCGRTSWKRPSCCKGGATAS